MTLVPRKSSVDMWRRYLEGKLGGGESRIETVSRAKDTSKKQENVEVGGSYMQRKNLVGKKPRKTSKVGVPLAKERELS